MSNQARKKFERRGRNTVLPITGDVVAEICLSTINIPAIVFRNSNGRESELTFEEDITVQHAQEEWHSEWRRPDSMSPLVFLLGQTVSEAIALPDGRLAISFTDDWGLQITPKSGFEAWHFLYPRPGRPVGGDVKYHIGITGDDGRLI